MILITLTGKVLSETEILIEQAKLNAVLEGTTPSTQYPACMPQAASLLQYRIYQQPCVNCSIS
ncbi:hypothetical protein J41TS12_14490 [Paenibacillus antibioticophila]|uniref:Uncharacterized protein n=1 Tax=Paenibacillus antibioticophila TaxID=1274374 RepID=A0A919XUE5_9BACL|nr:hypothetical protein J41TS12_14490 [Paenibacillus antibioticophila]